MALPFLLLWTSGAAGPTGGGGGLGERRRIKPQVRDAWSRTLSKKNWREIEALLAAELKAADKADETQEPEAKEALNAAADAAREAVEAIEAQRAEFAEVARLTAALVAATRASNTAAIIRQANIANECARAIIDELEDEEDTITMLLSTL